jgi:hypothetical protein
MVTRLIKPQVVIDASRRVAGVELRLKPGPSSYALLGAELSNSNVSGLGVTVSVGSRESTFTPSLAFKSDDIQTGLPDEYVEAVMAGAVKVANSTGLPTNSTLWFRWAAHGLVGSSPSIFERVGSLVARLLTVPKNASSEQLRALFSE